MELAYVTKYLMKHRLLCLLLTRKYLFLDYFLNFPSNFASVVIGSNNGGAKAPLISHKAEFYFTLVLWL